MDVTWHRCSIHYYLREKYFGQARKIAKNASKQFSNNNIFHFYHGIAHILEGQAQKGISELTSLQGEPDIGVAVLIALVYGHKSSTVLERDSMYNIESKLKEERKQANSVSLYYAGLFLSLAEKYEKASDYINKAIKKDSNNVDAVILKGWNDIYSNVGNLQTASLDCLELALTKSNKHPEALLGLAKFKHFAKDYDASNLTLDRLIVSNPDETVPLVEKMKNEFAMQKWDAVYDALERVFASEPDNAECLKMKIFIALCKNSDHIEAADQLNRFLGVLESAEGYNAHQFLETAQVFSRACGRASAVLAQTYGLAQRASELRAQPAAGLAELGRQCLLQGKIKDALSFFKAASKLDTNSLTALCGLTTCQIAENGPTEQAAQQVELMFEMQGNSRHPVLYLLSAKLEDKNAASAMKLLNSAMETKLSLANVHPFGLTYVKELDPDFLLEVYSEYKKHLPKRPSVIVDGMTYTRETNSSAVNSCVRLLETVVAACPGLVAAVYELAKLKFLFGFADEAQRLAQQIAELDNTHAGSQVLLAQIYIQQQNFAKASQLLEVCLSYNFKVRDSALYHLLNGVILKSRGQLAEALRSLSQALGLVSARGAGGGRLDAPLAAGDLATLRLQLVDIHSALGQFAEAGIAMQDAVKEFSYTPEEGRLQIAKADLALKKGDVDKAIDLLNDIRPGQPYYFQAHTKLAHVYLKEKKDKAMFTNCFKEVVVNHPMSDAHSLMGDAYMSINEPEQASEAYAAALAESPTSAPLVRKLGAALLRTHEYDRAARHYEAALRTHADEQVQFDYVDMMTKLKQYEKADAYLTEELNQPGNKEKNLATLKRRVKFLQMQANVRELQNPNAGNTSLILAEAKDLQSTVVKRIEIDSSGDLVEEKKLLSEILCTLAKVKSFKEPALAANLYSEALIYSPKDPNILLDLAKLYAQMNDVERCERTCGALLAAAPEHEAAAVMMADLAFRKVDFDTAHRHLSQLLAARPRGWRALAQLMEVCARRGRAADAEPALDAARDAEPPVDEDDPGYRYCLGIYSALRNAPNAALRHLNAARRSELGPLAARRMLLLCLSHTEPERRLTDEQGDTRALALRTAEKLLPELPGGARRPLQALLAVAAGPGRAAAERVLQDALPLAGEEGYQDDPYLLLALATAYNILKQPTRAKNLLKRTVSSIPWTPENADGLERCWLEVVEQQVSSGRADAARELLTRVLSHNRSCAPAYQYLGQLAEKDQNYKLAAHNYQQAWEHSGQTNLAVGYRLAQATQKLKKYPECIVVCRAILKAQPDYPKIKKEILEKAKNNLRT